MSVGKKKNECRKEVEGGKEDTYSVNISGVNCVEDSADILE
jgi:hypothetical protein